MIFQFFSQNHGYFALGSQKNQTKFLMSKGRGRQPFACRGPKTNFITLWRAALFLVTFSVLVIPTEVDIKQQKVL